MLMVHCPLDIIHSGVWQTAALEDLLPSLRGALDQFTFNQRFQYGAVIDSFIVTDEPGVILPPRLANLVTKNPE